MKKIQCELKKYTYLFAAFLMPVLFLATFYSLIKIYPFGDNTILFIDMNAQYVAFFEALRDAICGEGSLVYSWGRTLGGEFLGIYSYYLMSPLSYIVALFSEEKITLAILIITLIKSGLSGATMAFFLKNSAPNINKNATLLFSTMYALCSYSVVYVSNTMWIDALIWLPLVIYGLEQIFYKKKYGIFIIALSMSIVSNFYTGYMICLFVIMYYFYLLIKDDTLNQYNTKKEFFFGTFIRIALASIAAVLISCIALIPACYGLSFGKTEFSNPNWMPSIYCGFKDFVKGFLACSENSVNSVGTPYLYCGLLPIILLLFSFLSNTLSKREKIANAFLIGGLSLTFFVSTFQLIIHCGQYPVWFNYRYSFMLPFVIILISHNNFYDFYKISRWKIILVGVLFAIITSIVCLLDENITALFINLFIILSITIGILIIKSCKKNIKAIGKFIVISAVIFDMILSGMCNMALSRDIATAQKQSDFEKTTYVMNYAVDYITQYDNGFYRFDKTFLRSCNDNVEYGFRGVSGSTSTLNSGALNFVRDLGYGQIQHYSQYMAGSPIVSDSLTGIKYIVSDQLLDNSLYELVMKDSNNNIYVYKNPFALSIGYAANEKIKNYKSNSSLHTCEKINELVSALTGDNVLMFKKITVSEPVVQIVTEKANNKLGQKNYNVITYYIDIPKELSNTDKMFVEIDEYCKKIVINGQPYSREDGTTSYLDILMQLNDVDVTTTKAEVSFFVEMDDDNKNEYFKYDKKDFYYISTEEFLSAYDVLSETQLHVEEFSSTKINGFINVKDKGTIFTTIPYDKNFRVYVDGEQVHSYKTCDSMLTFDVPAGTHNITIQYIPYQLYIGAVLSLLGIIMSVFLIKLSRKNI